jgi:hypothetical protein
MVWEKFNEKSVFLQGALPVSFPMGQKSQKDPRLFPDHGMGVLRNDREGIPGLPKLILNHEGLSPMEKQKVFHRGFQYFSF